MSGSSCQEHPFEREERQGGGIQPSLATVPSFENGSVSACFSPGLEQHLHAFHRKQAVLIHAADDALS